MCSRVRRPVSCRATSRRESEPRAGPPRRPRAEASRAPAPARGGPVCSRLSSRWPRALCWLRSRGAPGRARIPRRLPRLAAARSPPQARRCSRPPPSLSRRPPIFLLPYPTVGPVHAAARPLVVSRMRMVPLPHRPADQKARGRKERAGARDERERGAGVREHPRAALPRPAPALLPLPILVVAICFPSQLGKCFSGVVSGESVPGAQGLSIVRKDEPPRPSVGNSAVTSGLSRSLGEEGPGESRSPDCRPWRAVSRHVATTRRPPKHVREADSRPDSRPSPEVRGSQRLGRMGRLTLTKNALSRPSLGGGDSRSRGRRSPVAGAVFPEEGVPHDGPGGAHQREEEDRQGRGARPLDDA